MDFIHELYQIKTLILTEVAPHFLYLGRGVGSIMCAIMVAVISCSIFLQDGILPAQHLAWTADLPQ